MTSEPPSYSAAADQSNGQLPSEHPQKLVLDGTIVFAAESPSITLYELDSPPAQALAFCHSVKKIVYRTTEDNQIKSRPRHLYDFRDKVNAFGHVKRNDVIIEGQASSKFAFKEINVSHGVGGWLSCTAAGHFKTSRASLMKKASNDIGWKDENGNVVAVEMRAPRRPEGELHSLPHLELKAQLSDKRRDLLVACWAARVWKEAQKDLAGSRGPESQGYDKNRLEEARWKELKKVAQGTISV